MSKEQRHGYCALCISRCGCIGTLEDGVLTHVAADPAHPTGQALCVKAKAAPEAVYAPERILYPLRRTQPKSSVDPSWQRISWDEALDLLVAKIRGAMPQDDHAVATALVFGVATPSGTAVADSFGWIHRLAHACRSPNLVFATENCNWFKDFAPADSFGAGIGMPDYAKTNCIVLWGFNPTVTWLAQATAVQKARQRGAKLIVIDPRRSGLANVADLWLRPRPGTDAALALGLANCLIASGAHDEEFLMRWTDAPFLIAEDNQQLLSAADLDENGDPMQRVIWDLASNQALPCSLQPPNDLPKNPNTKGRAETDSRPALNGRYTLMTRRGPVVCRPVFEHLTERCRAWTPARVEAVTGVASETLITTAQMIADNTPWSFFTWTGTCQHTNASQTSHAISTLYGLTGCIDAPGGNVWFTKPALTDIQGFDLVTPQQRAETLGIQERPHGPAKKGWITTRDLFKTIVTQKPYPVSCLVSFGSNFLHSKPQTLHAQDALEKLEFFALTELYETPTARYADLLLPVCSAWEREGLQAGFMVNAAAEAHVQLRPAFVAPQGESRSDTWIVFELARRLGFNALFSDADPETALAEQLAPSGLTPTDLRNNPQGITLPLETRYRKYLEQGFSTPSGRLEFYSERLHQVGLNALAGGYTAPDAGNTSRFPLTLVTAKWPQYCHSQQRNQPSLRKRMPEPLVEIHPQTAEQRGIQANDWVEISSAVGRMRARARFDTHLAPEVICAQYGWWQFSDGAGDANRLCDGESFDPVSGSNNLRATPCEVSAVKSA